MWTTILNLAIKLIGLAIDKSTSDREAKKIFLEFVERLGAVGLVQVQLNSQDMAQVEELRKLRQAAEVKG